ncbi:MAG: DEAD/DEAH box helicase family protein, partial [Candidatus Methanofastidiosia archaeon]
MDSHFPYPKKRAYQEEFMKLIDENFKCKRNLALEAATGFGKTVCVLSSLLPLAQELSKKIVYLCRTHKQMDRVIEELSEIHKKVKVSGISLRGRRELCLNSLVLNHTRDASSAQHVCSLLRKMGKCEFHKKTKEEEERVFELELALSQRPTYAREILDICQSEGFCPYDLSKELLGDVELVACSYLYMFHPEIRKNFLESIGCRMEDLILILDEAHNLPELAINLGSSRLSILSMRGGVREALEYEEEEIARFLEFTQKIVLELSEKYEIEDEVLLNPKELTQRFFSEKLEFLSSKALVLELFEARLLEFLSYMKKRGQEIQKDRLKKEKPPRSFIHTASLFFKNWILLKDREDYCYLLKKYE